MWLAVNVLKSSPEISDWIKGHDTQLNLFDIKGKVASKFCGTHFSSVSDHLTLWLSKCVLKEELSWIEVTTFFGLITFQNLRIDEDDFFFQNLQNFVYISKMQ